MPISSMYVVNSLVLNLILKYQEFIIDQILLFNQIASIIHDFENRTLQTIKNFIENRALSYLEYSSKLIQLATYIHILVDLFVY